VVAFNLRVECVDRRFKLVAAACVAEADDLAPVARQAVRADPVSRPRAALIDAIFEAKLVGQGLGALRQLLGLGDRFIDAADHVERRFG
jgi:hypothetical protein